MRDIRTLVWSRPGPLLTAAGEKGELLAAQIRLLLTAVLLLIPLINFILASRGPESIVGFGATASAFLISLLVYVLIDEGFNRPWLGFASSSFDVTLVSI